MKRNDQLMITLAAAVVILSFGVTACKTANKKKKDNSKLASQLNDELYKINMDVVQALRTYSRAKKASPGDAARLKQAHTTIRTKLRALTARYRSTKVPISSARHHYKIFGVYLKDYIAFIETILVLDAALAQTPKVSPQRRDEIVKLLKAAKKKWDSSTATLKADQGKFASEHGIGLERNHP